jgi:hypothetical protein
MPQSAFFKQRNRCQTDQNQTSYWIMKKTILIASVIASLAGLSASGQGYFLFTAPKHTVWDGFTIPSLSQCTTNVNVAFLWAASGSVPQVAAMMGATPTNLTVATSTFLPSAVWTAILTDPNFTLAVNGVSGQVAVARSTALGALNYNGGSGFPVTGSSAGVTYALFMVGWDAGYATPVLAAAASASVGWSSPFDYTPATFTSTLNSMAVQPFGVAGPIPEPSALALAGLGGLSLMLLRRRK